MTDYSELKLVAEACEISGDDVQLAPHVVLGLIEQNKALRGLYQMHKATETREMRDLKAAFTEWDEKTTWVQKSAQAHELGMHRADVLKGRIDRLKVEVEALRKDAERYRWLRDSSEAFHSFYLSTPIWLAGAKFSKENVDRSIDAAMSKEAGQ